MRLIAGEIPRQNAPEIVSYITFGTAKINDAKLKRHSEIARVALSQSKISSTIAVASRS